MREEEGITEHKIAEENRKKKMESREKARKQSRMTLKQIRAKERKETRK